MSRLSSSAMRAGFCITSCSEHPCRLDDFLEPSVRTTQTRLKSFELDELLESDAIKTILDGLLNDGDFLLKE